MFPFRSLLLCLALILGGISPGHAQGSNLPTSCDKAKVYDASTNGSTQLVASGAVIQICGYTIWGGGTATVKLVYGTGVACATGETAITPAFSITAQTGIVEASPYFRGMNAPPGNALCIKTSAGVAVQAVIYYSQGPS